MRVPLTLAALSSAAGQSNTPQIASALLLGLVVRHLCERLDLPAEGLMKVLQREVDSLSPPDAALTLALAEQLAVVRAVISLDAGNS